MVNNAEFFKKLKVKEKVENGGAATEKYRFFNGIWYYRG